MGFGLISDFTVTSDVKSEKQYKNMLTICI